VRGQIFLASFESGTFMKKNILVVQLLLLPLVTSSLMLSMENSNKGQNRQQRRYQAVQQKKALKKLQMIEQQKKEAAQKKPTKQAKINETPDFLLQSVILPTEEQGLGWAGTFNYYVNDPISNIISYLTTQSFNTFNGSHFKLLNEAIAQAVQEEDFDSLAIITALCRSTEEYKNKIRIPDTIAQPAFEFCSKTYTQEIADSNETMSNNYQNSLSRYNTRTIAFSKALSKMIESYNEDIRQIANLYHSSVQEETTCVTTMQKKMCALSALNASIRNNTKTLITEHTITAQTNNLPETLEQSQQKLNNILAISDAMPTPIVLSNNLQLTNK